MIARHGGSNISTFFGSCVEKKRIKNFVHNAHVIKELSSQKSHLVQAVMALRRGVNRFFLRAQSEESATFLPHLKEKKEKLSFAMSQRQGFMLYFSPKKRREVQRKETQSLLDAVAM